MATLETDIPTEGATLDLDPGVDTDALQLDEDEVREIVNYMTSEINTAESDRSELEEEWKEVQKLYEATEIEEKKNFPFEGAATIMIQVIATFVEEVWAWLLGIVFSPRDIFSTEPKREDFLRHGPALKKFITWACKEELDFEAVMSDCFLELSKLGGCVTKTVYTEEDRELRVWDEGTQKYQKIVERFRSSPEIIHIGLNDFFYPMWIKNLDEAPWLAHRVKLTPAEIRRRADRGVYDADAVDELFKKSAPKQNTSSYDQSRDEAALTRSVTKKEFEVFEVWLDFLVKEKAVDQETPKESPEKLVVTFDKDSGIILRAKYNTYPLQLHPFDMAAFIPREKKIQGIGVGKAALPSQIEVSAIRCQRLDNKTVSNCVAYAYKPDSLAGPSVKLAPGRGIPLDNPREDLVPISLGSPFSSTTEEEEYILKSLRDRLGVGKEVELGETSTNAIIRAQEARTKSNAILKGVRRFMTSIMEKTILLYQAHYPEGKISEMFGEDGALVEELFAQSPLAVYYGMGVHVTATTSAVSKNQDQQNKLAIFNMLVQYYQQAMQYLVPTQNPEAPPAMRAASMDIINSLGIFIRELLDDFDIPGRDKLVFDPTKFMGLAAETVGAAGGAPPNANAGMEDLSQLPPSAPPIGGQGLA